MKRKYRSKNAFCKNTKLSEDEISRIVLDYCCFMPASRCAKSVKRSRQTIQGVYTKLGERLAYMFANNDFPNFSGSVAIELMPKEKDLRTILSVCIQPKTYDLIFIDKDECLFKGGEKQNLIIVKKTESDLFVIRIFDQNGEFIDYQKIPENLCTDLEQAPRIPLAELEARAKIVEKIMHELKYTQPEIKMYDELIPKFNYEAYLDYRERGDVLDPSSNTAYHSRYRVLNYMLRTENALRGFSKEKFINYLSRARLMELMLYCCNWGRQKYDFLNDDKEIKYFARDAAYILIMLSLRYKPLSLQ